MSIIVVVPPSYTTGGGLELASTLARRTQWLSAVLMALAWVLIGLGTSAGVLATVYVSEPTPKYSGLHDLYVSHPGLLLGLLSVLSLGLGRQIYDRSQAATRLSSTANRAIGLATSTTAPASGDPKRANAPVDPDRAAYDLCVEAKSAWLEGRLDDRRLDELTAGLPKAGGGD